jgi:hypothetical protein
MNLATTAARSSTFCVSTISLATQLHARLKRATMASTAPSPTRWPRWRASVLRRTRAW